MLCARLAKRAPAGLLRDKLGEANVVEKDQIRVAAVTYSSDATIAFDFAAHGFDKGVPCT